MKCFFLTAKTRRYWLICWLTVGKRIFLDFCRIAACYMSGKDDSFPSVVNGSSFVSFTENMNQLQSYVLKK